MEKPSQEEIDLRRLTDLPFRSWCEECVAVKSKESPHKSLVTPDFKDAFLLVDQIELVACRFPAEFVELMGIPEEYAKKFAWILWKVLPGQRNAAALWGNHLANDLIGFTFSRCPLAPCMYKDKNGTLLTVHVDDVQGMGKEHCLRNLVTALKKKYVVSLEGPFLLAADYVRGYSLDTIKFLKRKFSYFNRKLSICIDPKYIQNLEELFRLSHRKPKAAPCGNDILRRLIRIQCILMLKITRSTEPQLASCCTSQEISLIFSVLAFESSYKEMSKAIGTFDPVSHWCKRFALRVLWKSCWYKRSEFESKRHYA